MADIDPKRYQLALILTSVVVVIYLCVLAIKYFGNSKVKIRYPPWLSPCPDYWASDEGGCCRRTEDANGEGNGDVEQSRSSQGIAGNYGAKTPSGTSSACLNTPTSPMSYINKCKWARESNIHWQGISDVPCVADSFTQYTG